MTLSSHPADDARMQVMLTGLRNVGFHQESETIKKRWEEMNAISGFKPEPEYYRCFPPSLLESLTKKALDGIKMMGGRIADSTTNDPIYNIINQAWIQFWKDPMEYANWERSAVSDLRKLCK